MSVPATSGAESRPYLRVVTDDTVDADLVDFDSIDWSTAPEAHRRWLEQLDVRVADYRRKSKSENTLRAYEYALSRWEQWCTDPTVRSGDTPGYRFKPYPAAEKLLVGFLTDWFERRTAPADECDEADCDVAEMCIHGWRPPSPSSIRQLLSALRWKHRQLGLVPPEQLALKETLIGLTRSWYDLGFSSEQAEPLLLDEIIVICGWLHANRISNRSLRDGGIVATYRAGLGLTDIARAQMPDLTIIGGRVASIAVGDTTVTLDDEDGRLVYQWLTRRGLPDGPQDRRPVFPTVDETGAITEAAGSKQATRAVLQRVARHAGHRDWTTAQPLTPELVDAMIAVCQAPDPAVVRDHSIILNGFWGALRRSEITGRDIGDDTLLADGGLRFDLGVTKTNQNGAKQEFVVIRAVEKPGMDPVAVHREWLGLLEALGDDGPGTPIYRPIDRTGRIALSTSANSGRLDSASVTDVIRRRAIQAGIASDDPDNDDGRTPVGMYSGHSLRRGFVTTLAAARYDAAYIAKFTRHSDLRQLQVYVDEARLLDPSTHPATTLAIDLL